MYMIDRKYSKALEALKKARQEWIKELAGDTLKGEVEMYFDISIGQVYEETNNLKVALRYFMKARSIDLYYNHPDKAFPFSCLG